MNTRTVVIFGVFDGIHEGHREFIKEAHTHGQQLVVIVARDNTVLELKGKLPTANETERINMLLEIPDIDRVLLGDVEEGTYKTLTEVKPSIVCLGYDQKILADSIKKAIKNGIVKEVEIIFAKAHKPEKFKSSILNNKK